MRVPLRRIRRLEALRRHFSMGKPYCSASALGKPHEGTILVPCCGEPEYRLFLQRIIARPIFKHKVKISRSYGPANPSKRQAGCSAFSRPYLCYAEAGRTNAFFISSNFTTLVICCVS